MKSRTVLSLVGVLLISACVAPRRPTPQPAPIPPEPPKYSVTIELFARAGSETDEQAIAADRKVKRGLLNFNGDPYRTDDAGNVTVTGQPAGRHGIHVIADGFKDVFVDFDVPSSSSIRVVIDPLPTFTPRRGVVRIRNQTAVEDDDGPFNALGASLFYAPHAYKFDRLFLEAQLARLAGGVDYVRILGSVGGGSWSDREIDPRWPDYDDVIAGFVDLAYDKYGIRTQITIFGGFPGVTDSQAQREALVDRIGAIVRLRPDATFAAEISNESWQNGFPDPRPLRELGRRLQAQIPNLVALSTPEPSARAAEMACGLYAGAEMRAATMHYDRDISKADRQWRPVRQPWGWPGEYDMGCPGQLPTLVLNNEPIGPYSSVAEDGDPLRIVMAYVTTFIARNGAYVYHAGAGIRGGGAADIARGRPAAFDFPGFTETMRGFAAAKKYLPPGLASWAKQNGAWPGHPFSWDGDPFSDGRLVRAYATRDGGRWVVALIGLNGRVSWRMKAAGSFDVLDPLTGIVMHHAELRVGEAFSLEGRDTGLVIVGQDR